LEERIRAWQLRLSHQVQQKTDRKADRAVNDEPYIDKRKPSSTTAAKGDSNNGPSPKKTDENGNQVVDDKPFINKRKPSSTSAVKGNLNNGEHSFSVRNLSFVHLYICGDVASIVHTIPT
jgi:hypothetical protein